MEASKRRWELIILIGGLLQVNCFSVLLHRLSNRWVWRKVPVPPMIPNFMAAAFHREPPENPAASTAARLLAEVPVFKAEKKSEDGTS